MYCTVFIRCTTDLTRCHSLPFAVTHYHSLYHSSSLVVSLVVTLCHSLYHSLSLIVIFCHSPSLVIIRCHSLYHRCHSLSLVVTHCHSLSLVVPLVVTRCHALSFVVTRCTTRLSFYKRSAKFLELLKGAKHLQSNSGFMNKINERSNTAIFKPNATIKLGALFITTWSIHNLEIKELQTILTIPDFSEGIDKTSNTN